MDGWVFAFFQFPCHLSSYTDSVLSKIDIFFVDCVHMSTTYLSWLTWSLSTVITHRLHFFKYFAWFLPIAFICFMFGVISVICFRVPMTYFLRLKWFVLIAFIYAQELFHVWRNLCSLCSCSDNRFFTFTVISVYCLHIPANIFFIWNVIAVNCRHIPTTYFSYLMWILSIFTYRQHINQLWHNICKIPSYTANIFFTLDVISVNWRHMATACFSYLTWILSIVFIQRQHIDQLWHNIYEMPACAVNIFFTFDVISVNCRYMATACFLYLTWILSIEVISDHTLLKSSSVHISINNMMKLYDHTRHHIFILRYVFINININNMINCAIWGNCMILQSIISLSSWYVFNWHY